jgi:hypothetical protein
MLSVETPSEHHRSAGLAEQPDLFDTLITKAIGRL